MFVIIIMDNIKIQYYNYCLCCKLKFICYYLFIKSFGFYMPWQLPFPFPIPHPPPPLSTINCTTRTFKIYISIGITNSIFIFFSN